MSGLYIHIPFCRQKCLYCDFYTGGVRIADWTGLVKAFINELTVRSEEISERPSTIYIGGGTPSLLPSSDFKNLIEGIKSILGPFKAEEFTIEVNPEDVSMEKIETWLEFGVNRVSVGVQTLQDRELKLLGRSHDSKKAIEACRMLAKNIDNISIDLMFGIPGQTLESYRRSLEGVLNLSPAHISSYALMLEEGTAMTILHRENRISLPDEDLWFKMYDLTVSSLEEAGFERYEISNYCKPGRESRHNISYWHGHPYVGIGPGAHSYDGKSVRRWNPCDLKGYLNHFLSKDLEELSQSKFYSQEVLSLEEMREEMVMTRLRTVEGLNLKEFKDRFGNKAKEKLLQEARPFIKADLLQKFDDFLSFTRSGFAVSDSILPALI
ncbi:MAG: radical SAM family heme chaperone HemW [Muribaculaceae bacterium]|nr:radical SAM family heme chaperone HemW [Muribaculaceae bacterium]